MKLIALILTVAVGPAVSQLTCPFECFNNSTCAASNADFSNHPTAPGGQPFDFHTELSRDGKHCSCPPGWTGLRCARPYESCNDNQHNCYHGGQCVPGLEDVFTNSQFYCDCQQAVGPEGTSYVGQYCEIAAITKCDAKGEKFCVNGKTCKSNFQDTPLEPCDCGDDYEGPHCEFRKGRVPRCTLDCINGGQCRLGLKNLQYAELGYEDFWSVPSDRMYCECPVGFTGAHCDIEAQACGNKHCFNGGSCAGTTPSGGPICNCTGAHSLGTSFAGLYCQYEATTFCEKTPDANGQIFCTNGGTCNKDGAHLGCTCTDFFEGPSCEFRKGVDVQKPCTLDCLNDGKCRNGVKDTSTLSSFGPALTELANQTHDGNFQYCECPDGFAGLKCGRRVETCGNNDHLCFHGSKCVQEAGEYKCNCDPSFSMFTRSAGKYCENTASEICTANGEPGVGRDQLAFCVNGGTCNGNADGNGHPGCKCPAEYVGDHCEFLKSDVEAAAAEESTSGSGSRSRAGTAIIYVVFSIVIVVLAGAIYYYRKSSLKSKDGADLDLKPATTTSSDDSQASGPVLDMGPEKDLDGNELENVEII